MSLFPKPVIIQFAGRRIVVGLLGSGGGEQQRRQSICGNAWPRPSMWHFFRGIGQPHVGISCGEPRVYVKGIRSRDRHSCAFEVFYMLTNVL